MTLHLVSQQERFEAAYCGEQDIVVLISDGIYCRDSLPVPVYVIRADREARGLDLPPDQQDLDYEAFVVLCTEHEKVVSW